MTALNLIWQGLATATELMALLFVAPAWATAPSPASATPLPQMHAIEGALEVRWLDFHRLESLGGLRTVRALQNADAPASLDSDSPCGGDVDNEESESDSSDNAHAVLNLDEALADAARITQVTWLASRRKSDARAFFFVDGAIRYLAIVPPPAMHGEVTLTLRPRRGASEVVALGRIDGIGKAILIPRAAREAADDLAIEAIELEARSVNEVSWVTVPLASSSRHPTSASLASAAR